MYPLLHHDGGVSLLPSDSSNRNMRFNILRRPFYRLSEHFSFIALKALYPLGQPVAAAVLWETGEGIEGGGEDSVYVKRWPVQFDDPHDRNIAH